MDRLFESSCRCSCWQRHQYHQSDTRNSCIPVYSVFIVIRMPSSCHHHRPNGVPLLTCTRCTLTQHIHICLSNADVWHQCMCVYVLFGGWFIMCWCVAFSSCFWCVRMFAAIWKANEKQQKKRKKKHFLFYWESKVSATTMNSTFCCFICKQRISLCFFLSCIWRVNSLLVDLLYSRNKNNFSRTSKRAYTQSYIWTITKEVKYKKKSALLYSNGTYCTRSLYSFFSLLFFFLIFYAVFFIFCVCISVCDS